MKLTAALLAICTTGCGSTLWLITPRPDVTYYEVSRTSSLQVVTTPPGATLYIDGAEAGTTPRPVSVSYKEVRRQRKQSIWPALIGSLIDLAAASILTVAAANDPGAEAALPIAAVGAGILILDMYLITGRSTVNEGVDLLSGSAEIGVRSLGYHDAARRIRVPDFTTLHFPLVPLTAAVGAPTLAPPVPQSTPAPASVPAPRPIPPPATVAPPAPPPAPRTTTPPRTAPPAAPPAPRTAPAPGRS